MDDPYLVALLGIPLADGAAVVGRAVIDEYELIIGVSLLQDAFYASLQISPDFINGYYDAQFH